MLTPLAAGLIFLAILFIIFWVGAHYGTFGFLLALVIDVILIAMALGFGAGHLFHIYNDPPTHPVTLSEAVAACGSPDKVATFNDRTYTCKTAP